VKHNNYTEFLPFKYAMVNLHGTLRTQALCKPGNLALKGEGITNKTGNFEMILLKLQLTI